MLYFQPFGWFAITMSLLHVSPSFLLLENQILESNAQETNSFFPSLARVVPSGVKSLSKQFPSFKLISFGLLQFFPLSLDLENRIRDLSFSSSLLYLSNSVHAVYILLLNTGLIKAHCLSCCLGGLCPIPFPSL